MARFKKTVLLFVTLCSACLSMPCVAEFIDGGQVWRAMNVLAIELSGAGTVREEVVSRLVERALAESDDSELESIAYCVGRLVETGLLSEGVAERLASRLELLGTTCAVSRSLSRDLRRTVELRGLPEAQLKATVREILRAGAGRLQLAVGEPMELSSVDAAILALDRGWGDLLPAVEVWCERNCESFGVDLRSSRFPFSKTGPAGGRADALAREVVAGRLSDWPLVEAIARMQADGEQGLALACKRVLDASDQHVPQYVVREGRLERQGVYLSKQTRLAVAVCARRGGLSTSADALADGAAGYLSFLLQGFRTLSE